MAGFERKTLKAKLGDGEYATELFDDIHKYASRIRTLNAYSVPYMTFRMPNKDCKEGIVYNKTILNEKGVHIMNKSENDK